MFGFFDPLPPSSAFHATYQYCLSAKWGNFSTPLPPSVRTHLSNAPKTHIQGCFNSWDRWPHASPIQCGHGMLIQALCLRTGKVDVSSNCQHFWKSSGYAFSYFHHRLISLSGTVDDRKASLCPHFLSILSPSPLLPSLLPMTYVCDIHTVCPNVG